MRIHCKRIHGLVAILCLVWAATMMFSGHTVVRRNDVCASQQQVLDELPPQRQGDPAIKKKRLAQYNRTPKQNTYDGLLALKSDSPYTTVAPVTVILNMFNRRTLCRQLDSIFTQSIQPAHVWVALFNSPDTSYFQRVVDAYNDTRISTIVSTHDFRFYGRFQLALQATTKYVWIIDDDVMPGTQYLNLCLHAMGTVNYKGVLGSIGWILPAQRDDGNDFPSYRDVRGGLYVPDPAYDLYVEHVVEVDLLCSMWFLETDWVKLLFREKELSFDTGEDFALSFALRKHANVKTFVLPVDRNNTATWGDTDHRYAYERAATVGSQNFGLRDSLWYQHYIRGGSLVRPRPACDEERCPGPHLVIIDGVAQARSMSSFIRSLKDNNKSVIIAITGGTRGACVEVVDLLPLKFDNKVCHGNRRAQGFFDMRFGHDFFRNSRPRDMVGDALPFLEEVFRAVEPSAVYASVDESDKLSLSLRDVIHSVAKSNKVPHATPTVGEFQFMYWLPTLPEESLAAWDKPAFVINVISMSRSQSLQRLLGSLLNAYYLGDKIALVLHVDAGDDSNTMKVLRNFTWPYGVFHSRVRNQKVGLIDMVVSCWYPTSLHEYAVLLKDDMEVSPYWYIWAKQNVLNARYDSTADSTAIVGLSLYSSRLNDSVHPRARWDSVQFLSRQAPEFQPYLSQTPCSWGAVYFPEHWVQFRTYMRQRFNLEFGEVQVGVVQNSRSISWKESWMKFMNEYMYSRGFSMVYPNFRRRISFSTNHMEPGERMGLANKSKLEHSMDDFTVPLMRDFEDYKSLQGERLPKLRDMLWLDNFNEIISESIAIRRGHEANFDIFRCDVEAWQRVAIIGWELACIPAKH